MLVTGRRHLLAGLLAGTAFTVAMPAAAQSAAEADTVDYEGEIVVTAQKREQNLQDVPISIQALGTQKLDNLNVTNVNQVTALLPSVSIDSGGTPGTTQVFMRGVATGGDGNHSAALPLVGVYLDEQPITTIGGTPDVHIYDIARIESLAGPQGTLFGASSEAGTLRIITNKPQTGGFEGRIDLEGNSVEKGGKGGKVEGMINVPLSGMAALRIVGFYQKDAGFIDNVPGTRNFIPPAAGGGGSQEASAGSGTTTQAIGTQAIGTAATGPYTGTVTNAEFVKEDYNEVDTWGGRAALKIDLDDTWTVEPTLLYQENRTSGFFATDPSVGDLQVQHFYPEYSRDRFIQAALTVTGQLGNWDVTYAGAYFDRKASSASDYTDYAEYYDSYYASSGGIANYQAFEDAAGNTIDPRQLVFGSDHFKKMSHELRVASPVEDRFRVVAGLFFQRQTNDIFQNYTVPHLSPDLSVGLNPGTLWLTKQYRVDTDYAMFGEASFDITDRITLTAGGRGFIYDNSLIGFFGFGDSNPGGFNTGENRCFGTDGLRIVGYSPAPSSVTGQPIPGVIPGTPCNNLANFVAGKGIQPITARGQGFTHRVNLTFKPSDDVLLYGTWSRGFRPGGINRRADVAPYDPDYLTNYELGAKLTLLDGRLRLNTAVYQQEWKRFQFGYLGPNSFTVVLNGPDARIKGVEADASLSLGGLALTAAAAYNDTRTLNNLCRVADPTFTCSTSSITAPAGTRLPLTPDFKVNGTARYTAPLGGDVKAYGQVVVTHQSEARSALRDSDATSQGPLAAYTSGSLAAGIDTSRYTFELYIDNVSDERAELSKFQACGACAQRTYTVVSRPRTFGLRVGAKF